MTTKPKIELKNIKHSAFASEETHCYQATVYVDGKRWAIVGNDGHGGCDYLRPLKGDRANKIYAEAGELEKRIKATYPKVGGEWEESLESICFALLNDHLVTRYIERTLRTKVCALVKGGQILCWKRSARDGLAFRAEIEANQRGKGAPVVSFIEDLSTEERLRVWHEAI